MATRKLVNHPSAQAHIEERNDGTLRLYSYSTMVAKTDTEGYVYVREEYSKTTMNHIKWFLHEVMGVNFTTKDVRNIFFGEFNGIHTAHGDLVKNNIHWNN